MSQDPFEEFEFRPITEGLGFHKKKDMTSEPDVLAPVTSNKILSPKMRASDHPSIEMPITNSTVDSVLDSLKSKRKPLTFEEPKALDSAKTPVTRVTPTKGKTWESSLPDLSAIILDAMLVLAGVLATLIVTILTTQADLIAWGKSIGTLELSLTLYGLFACISFIYTTVCRAFLGFTAGEWVTDQAITTQAGKGFKALSAIMARAFVNIFTLYVTLPMLSNAMGQDLAGQITGAQLSKEKL